MLEKNHLIHGLTLSWKRFNLNLYISRHFISLLCHKGFTSATACFLCTAIQVCPSPSASCFQKGQSIWTYGSGADSRRRLSSRRQELWQQDISSCSLSFCRTEPAWRSSAVPQGQTSAALLCAAEQLFPADAAQKHSPHLLMVRPSPHADRGVRRPAVMEMIHSCSSSLILQRGEVKQTSRLLSTSRNKTQTSVLAQKWRIFTSLMILL